MKRKAIAKRLEIKNKPFIEAIKIAVSKRNEIHEEILDNAKKNGILSKLHLSK